MTKSSKAGTQKTKALLEALKNAPFDGWPKDSLDLVLYFSAWADAETLKKLPAKKLQALRVRDRIALGVRTRLEILAPHREALRASLKFLKPPPRHLYLPRLVWNTADALWRAAGDTSTDYNHYTKRLLLSGVITATTLFWLNDDSRGFEKTWAFLDKRIDNVLKIGAALGRLKKPRAA